MKITWDKLCRAAFATAAAATLWASSSIAAAAAAAPDVPDRDADGDDGILGDGAIDSIEPAVGQAGPAAVGDYLDNLAAAWEDVSWPQLSAPSPDGLTARDCAELPLPGAAGEADGPAELVVEPEPEAVGVDALVDVEPAEAAEEAVEPVVEAVAEPEAIELPADSVDADLIVEDAAGADAQDLAAEWSLSAAAAGESFTFDDSTVTNEDTAAPTEPEAVPAEAAPAGPEARAAAAWFQTVLERYNARPIGASAVRPVFCVLSEPSGSPGF